jgi:hypothetical protein
LDWIWRGEGWWGTVATGRHSQNPPVFY